MIYICTNAELVADQVPHKDREVQYAVAGMFLERGRGPAEAAESTDYDTEPSFREWNGGSMYPPTRQRYGALVACDAESELPEARRIAHAIRQKLAELAMGEQTEGRP